MALKSFTLRLAAVTAALFVILTLFYGTEPRRRSYSCKSWRSCLVGRPHEYKHDLPVDPDFAFRDQQLPDGTRLYERSIVGASPSLLALVLTKDADSWSRDFRSTDRNIYDFLDLLVSTELDFADVSLALLTTSKEDFAAAKKATESLPFARVSLYLRLDPRDPEDAAAAPAAYRDRHDKAVQRARRAHIARLRNHLMLRALDQEEHILWVDADVVEISDGLVQDMVLAAKTDKRAGLITAPCHQNSMTNYDKNAWVLQREGDAAPLLLGPVADDDRARAEEQLVSTRKYTDALVGDGAAGGASGDVDDELVPLDSVGGTILYMRASLVRDGLVFPTYNVVGTTWSKEGWVGVETEGLCYVASSLKGGKCFLMAGHHYVRHADWG